MATWVHESDRSGHVYMLPEAMCFSVAIMMILKGQAHERGFSFFSLYNAPKPHPATFTTLKRTPGISPTACPLRPNPEIRTSSFSSMKFKHPSRGTKPAIFLPSLMSWTRQHLRMAEFGCLASIPIFSTTMPLACEVPPKGLHLYLVPKLAFL